MQLVLLLNHLGSKILVRKLCILLLHNCKFLVHINVIQIFQMRGRYIHLHKQCM